MPASLGRRSPAAPMPCMPTSVPTRDTGEAFSKMRRVTVAKRGLSIDFGRPFVAIYLNDPLVTREMHRRTELCIPVMPMRMPLSSNDDGEQAAIARVLNERHRA